MLPATIVALLLANTLGLADAATAKFLAKSSNNQQSAPPILATAAMLATAAKEDVSEPVAAQLHHIGNFLQKPKFDPEDFKFDPVKYRIQLLTSWAVWLVLCVLIYFSCYRTESPLPKKQVRYTPDDAQQKLEELFQKGHFRCFEDSNICICSFLFPGLRWSDTTSLAGLLSFWQAFAAFFTLLLLNCLILLEMYSLFTLGLLLYYRHQLRDKLSLESWNFNTCFRDCCFICWCPCCAIAQEARIVKEAIEMGREPFETS